MWTIPSHSPLNISETVRDRGLVPKDHNQLENGIWGIKLSRDRWRHVTQKGQTRDSNTLRAQYLENSWRCYLATIAIITNIQCESKKSPPRGPDIFSFFHKRLRICNRFFTHLLNVPVFARWQIFIQLSPILTKLCHIKRDYQVHIICAKCPKSTKTRAFRRLRKSLIALLIVVCGKSL